MTIGIALPAALMSTVHLEVCVQSSIRTTEMSSIFLLHCFVCFLIVLCCFVDKSIVCHFEHPAKQPRSVVGSVGPWRLRIKVCESCQSCGGTPTVTWREKTVMYWSPRVQVASPVSLPETPLQSPGCCLLSLTLHEQVRAISKVITTVAWGSTSEIQKQLSSL